MFYIFRGNRLEELAQKFGALLVASPLPPLQSEKVVVQNAGMGRWLSLSLADQSGIAANIDYLFPGEIIWDLMHRVLPDAPRKNPLDRMQLTWRIYFALQAEPDKYNELRDYLMGSTQVAHWQLAEQIAVAFDRYLFYRPSWVREWDEGNNEDHWQAHLWHQTVSQYDTMHWAKLQPEFVKAVKGNKKVVLPERIIFFSTPEMSPSHLEMLAALDTVEVYFFLLDPCQEYWHDIVPERVIDNQPIEKVHHYYTGNALLADWGRLGRDFFQLLAKYPESFIHVEGISAEDFHQSYYSPQGQTLLAQVQRDILELTMPEQPVMWNKDDSIQIHSCHSSEREVQVVYDQILKLLEEDSALEPHDIAVMAPDISQYAVYLEQYIGHGEWPLPMTVSDQKGALEATDAILASELLRMGSETFSAQGILDLFEMPAVQQAWGWEESEHTLLRYWFEEAGIRGGWQSPKRGQEFHFSWSEGLQRLMLGVLMPGADWYVDRLAASVVHGQQQDLLVQVIEFLQAVEVFHQRCQNPHTLTQWAEEYLSLWHKLLGEMHTPATIYNALAKLQSQLDLVHEQDEIPWDVFAQALTRMFDAERSSSGFLARGIVCCEMLPMRSVPFKVVILLGMNDGALPRQAHSPSFDLMADKPHLGDRHRGDEDRYVFLETLLSVREKLIMTYIGRDIASNDEYPPALVVSQLLDYLKIHYGLSEADMTLAHPLQPFNAKYFDKTSAQYFSYQQQFTPPQVTKPLRDDPWPELAAQELPSMIDLADLIRFYLDPARFYLNQTLQATTEYQDDALPELSPQTMNASGKPWGLEGVYEELVQTFTQDQDAADPVLSQLRHRLNHQGAIAAGPLVEFEFEQIATQISDLIPQAIIGSEPIVREEVLALDQVVLSAHLSVYKTVENTRYEWCYQQSPSARQWVEIWSRHLVWSCLEAGAKTIILCVEGKQIVLEQQLDATELLDQLLGGYAQGHQVPLPFRPKLSHILCSRLKGDFSAENLLREKAKVLSELETAWIGVENNGYRGERLKSEMLLLYRDRPFWEVDWQGFMDWSDLFFGPLVRSLQQAKP